MVVQCTHRLASCISVAEKVNISCCGSQQRANDYNVYNIAVHRNIFNFLSMGPQPLFAPLTPPHTTSQGRGGTPILETWGSCQEV